jgi:hypothetical protein
MFMLMVTHWKPNIKTSKNLLFFLHFWLLEPCKITSLLNFFFNNFFFCCENFWKRITCKFLVPSHARFLFSFLTRVCHSMLQLYFQPILTHIIMCHLNESQMLNIKEKDSHFLTSLDLWTLRKPISKIWVPLSSYLPWSPSSLNNPHISIFTLDKTSKGWEDNA